MIDFLNLRAVNEKYSDQIKNAVASVLNAGHYILGEECALFEKEFASYVGVRHAIGVANGMDALSLIINGLKLGEGDEIIVPSNTFIASVLAIVKNRCVPVPVEPDMETYNIDAGKIEEKITDKTKAIMAVHLYGLPCSMDEVSRIASQYHLKIIEDASQSHGAMLNGKKTGSLSDAAGFSLYPTKNLGALGDGGIITTNDDALAKKFRALRNYGRENARNFTFIGTNSRLDELQAAILRVKLRSLDADNEKRSQIAQIYLNGIRNPALVLPGTPEGFVHVWHQFIVRTADRDALKKYLEEFGIGTNIHYPIPPHRQKALETLKNLNLPIADRIANEVLSLPMNPAVTAEQAYEIVEKINGW